MFHEVARRTTSYNIAINVPLLVVHTINSIEAN